MFGCVKVGCVRLIVSGWLSVAPSQDAIVVNEGLFSSGFPRA